MKFIKLAGGGLSRAGYVALVLLLIAAAFRFWMMCVKPPQFDEAVNAFVIDRMGQEGFYKYDPSNYHGPLHFYALYFCTSVLGKTIFALRLPVILVGIATIALILAFKRYFGSFAVLIAALGMAVSPGYVFYQRYSIHESWQVFFMVLSFWGLLGVLDKGDRRSMVALIFGFAGMVVTKETYLMHSIIMLMALACIQLWEKVVPATVPLIMPCQSWTWRGLQKPFFIAVTSVVLLYTGGFFNFEGLWGIISSHYYWVKTGLDTTTGFARHDHQLGFFNYYWFWLCFRYEPWVILGLLMGGYVVSKADWKLRLLAVYGLGLLLAYSLLPYKTPWCIISIIWPFYFLAGALLEKLYFSRFRVATCVVGAAALVFSVWRTVDLNYYGYDNDDEPYAYVQTSREIAKFTGPLDAMLARQPGNFNIKGLFYVSSHFPLAWMLNEFTRIDFLKRDSADKVEDADIVLCESDDVKLVAPRLKAPYYRVDFIMHAGVWPCVAYFSPKVFAPEFVGEQPKVPSEVFAAEGKK